MQSLLHTEVQFEPHHEKTCLWPDADQPVQCLFVIRCLDSIIPTCIGMLAKSNVSRLARL